MCFEVLILKKVNAGIFGIYRLLIGGWYWENKSDITYLKR